MPKTILTRSILALALAVTLGACSEDEMLGAAVGAAGVVIADTIMEEREGGDGLF